MGGGADSIAEMSAPSSVYETLVKPTVGNHTYIVPANGYLVRDVSRGTATVFTTGMFGRCKMQMTMPWVYSYSLYCSKGESVDLTADSNNYSYDTGLVFIYSVGSAKKLGLI